MNDEDFKVRSAALTAFVQGAGSYPNSVEEFDYIIDIAEYLMTGNVPRRVKEDAENDD